MENERTNNVKKPEMTSARVASIAAKILRSMDGYPDHWKIIYWASDPVCTVAEIKALAASALTQTPDRPKVSKKRAGAKR